MLELKARRGTSQKRAYPDLWQLKLQMLIACKPVGDLNLEKEFPTNQVLCPNTMLLKPSALDSSPSRPVPVGIKVYRPTHAAAKVHGKEIGKYGGLLRHLGFTQENEPRVPETTSNNFCFELMFLALGCE